MSQLNAFYLLFSRHEGRAERADAARLPATRRVLQGETRPRIPGFKSLWNQILILRFCNLCMADLLEMYNNDLHRSWTCGGAFPSKRPTTTAPQTSASRKSRNARKFPSALTLWYVATSSNVAKLFSCIESIECHFLLILHFCKTFTFVLLGNCGGQIWLPPDSKLDDWRCLLGTSQSIRSRDNAWWRRVDACRGLVPEGWERDASGLRAAADQLQDSAHCRSTCREY